MTMKKIAEKAQVSVTTVANVIHGRRERVSEATYSRVEAVINENDFHLNRRAGLLAGKKQRIFVILDFQEQGKYGNYEKIGKLIKRSYQKGIVTLLYFPREVEDGLCFAKEWNADGIIIIGNFSAKEKICEELREKVVIRIR